VNKKIIIVEENFGFKIFECHDYTNEQLLLSYFKVQPDLSTIRCSPFPGKLCYLGEGFPRYLTMQKSPRRRRWFMGCWALAIALCSWWIAPAPALALGGKLPALQAPAPSFTLPTNTGEGQVSLQDYLGKWVVLYFYPKDFTSGCTIEARRFQQDIAQYQQRQAQIIGVSADSIDSHAKFCDSEGLKFPLLADTDGAVSKIYGSWLGIFSMRHTFIIDPQGDLQATFTGVNPAVHSQEVLAKLDELRSA
jgi:thioredoxin-dependent peroxiredoxin